MRLLVTGGAGYIGSAAASLLADFGHEVVVLDDLSTGHADAVPAAATFVRGTVRDDAQAVLAAGADAVVHFAAKSLVGESVANPTLYWQHNLGGTLALLEAMRVTGTTRIVFSSTAAVYGEPERIPIDETEPTRPDNPYGASKLAVDTALAEHARMHKIGAVSLRYFNVAGAHAGPDGTRLGERHNPESHLIPIVLQVAGGQRVDDAVAADLGQVDVSAARDGRPENSLRRSHPGTRANQREHMPVLKGSPVSRAHDDFLSVRDSCSSRNNREHLRVGWRIDVDAVMERETAGRVRGQRLLDVRDESARVPEEPSDRMLPVEGLQRPRIWLVCSSLRATATDETSPKAACVRQWVPSSSGPGKRVREQHDGCCT